MNPRSLSLAFFVVFAIRLAYVRSQQEPKDGGVEGLGVLNGKRSSEIRKRMKYDQESREIYRGKGTENNQLEDLYDVKEKSLKPVARDHYNKIPNQRDFDTAKDPKSTKRFSNSLKTWESKAFGNIRESELEMFGPGVKHVKLIKQSRKHVVQHQRLDIPSRRQKRSEMSILNESSTTPHPDEPPPSPTNNNEDAPQKLFCTKDATSCKNRCNNTRMFSTEAQLMCSCDLQCVYFYDCCADYHEYCSSYITYQGDISSPIPDFGGVLPDLGDRPVEEEMPPPWGNWTCILPGMNPLAVAKGAAGVWMVGHCPRSADQDTSSKCAVYATDGFPVTRANVKDVLPVFTPNGIVYRNPYCALCNGVSTADTKSYTLSFNCENQPPTHLGAEKRMDFLFEYCRSAMSWNPGVGQPRRYCFRVQQACGFYAPQAAKDKCKNSPPAIVYYNFRNYKNIDCVNCGRHNTSIGCGPGTKDKPGAYVPLVAPFNLVFNFGGKEGPMDVTTQVTCPLRSYYDPYLEICKEGLSPPPRASGNDEYRVLLWLRSLGFLNTSPDNLERELPLTLSQAFGMKMGDVTNVGFTDMQENQYKLQFDASVERKSARNKRSFYQLFCDQILNFDAPFNLSINGTTFNTFKATYRILGCFNLHSYQRQEYTTLNDTAVYLIDAGAVIQAKDYYHNGSSGEILVCMDGRTRNCTGTYVRLSENEYTMISNRSVYVNRTKEIFSHMEYVTRDGSLWICRNYSNAYTIRSEKGSEVLRMVTFVCLLISVIALGFVLVTYSLFSELRTTPGKNLMNLSTAILLSQIFWLSGSGQVHDRTACTVVAILLHYFFLASFIWTAIIAWDTWRAFSHRSHRSAKTMKRENLIGTLRCMAVGWLPALLFVAITTAIDLSGAVAIGYGSDVACWITNGTPLLVVFGLPVVVILVFNSIFYALTIIAIRATAKQARFASSDSRQKAHFWIYLRIAAIMGFTWVFGFIAAVGITALWYVFVILNCLQGVYIALAFALTERARNLYKAVVITWRMKLRDDKSVKTSTQLTMDSPMAQHNHTIDTRL